MVLSQNYNALYMSTQVLFLTRNHGTFQFTNSNLLFVSSPWISGSNNGVARMRLNFYDYHGFQQKITPVYTYATQCKWEIRVSEQKKNHHTVIVFRMFLLQKIWIVKLQIGLIIVKVGKWRIGILHICIVSSWNEREKNFCNYLTK